MNAICIKCWNPDAVVHMDLDGTCQFECKECGETFDREDVRSCLQAMNAKWERLLKWADAYPEDDATEEAKA